MPTPAPALYFREVSCFSYRFQGWRVWRLVTGSPWLQGEGLTKQRHTVRLFRKESCLLWSLVSSSGPARGTSSRLLVLIAMPLDTADLAKKALSYHSHKENCHVSLTLLRDFLWLPQANPGTPATLEQLLTHTLLWTVKDHLETDC